MPIIAPVEMIPPREEKKEKVFRFMPTPYGFPARTFADSLYY